MTPATGMTIGGVAVLAMMLALSPKASIARYFANSVEFYRFTEICLKGTTYYKGDRLLAPVVINGQYVACVDKLEAK